MTDGLQCRQSRTRLGDSNAPLHKVALSSRLPSAALRKYARTTIMHMREGYCVNKGRETNREARTRRAPEDQHHPILNSRYVSSSDRPTPCTRSISVISSIATLHGSSSPPRGAKSSRFGNARSILAIAST